MLLFGILASYTSLNAQTTQPFELTFGSNAFNEKAKSVRQTADRYIFAGGYGDVSASGNVDFSLSKISPSGNTMWTQYYGSQVNEYCNYMNMTADSTHFIFCGNSEGTQSMDGRVMLTDTAGNEVWSQVHNISSTNENYHYIEPTDDGGFIACGFRTDSAGSNDAYLAKMNSTGAIEWSKRYGGGSNDYAQMVHQTADGGYILVCDALSFSSVNNYDIWLIKTDSQGDVEWDVLIGDSTLVNGSQAVLICENGDYLVTGESTVDATFLFDFTFAMVSPTGQLKWYTYIGGVGSDAAFGVYESNPNRFVATGYSTTNSNNTLPLDLATIVIDSMGNEVGRNYYGGPSIDIGYDIQPSHDGGILIAGVRKSTFGDDYYILSLQEETVDGIWTLDEHGRKITVYPNPNMGNLIRFQEVINNGTIYIYGIDGREIEQSALQNTDSYQFTNQLSSGLYHIVILTDKERFNGKFVIR